MLYFRDLDLSGCSVCNIGGTSGGATGDTSGRTSGGTTNPTSTASATPKPTGTATATPKPSPTASGTMYFTLNEARDRIDGHWGDSEGANGNDWFATRKQ